MFALVKILLTWAVFESTVICVSRQQVEEQKKMVRKTTRLYKNNCKTLQEDRAIWYLFGFSWIIIYGLKARKENFELQQADQNSHLTVPVKVPTCQDSSCTRVPDRLGECRQHLALSCYALWHAKVERLCTKYEISVFHITTNRNRAISWERK